MNFSKQNTSNQRLYGVALAVAGAILLPAFALLPFTVHSTSTYYAVGSKFLGWGKHGALQSPQQVFFGWDIPPVMQAIGMIGLAAFVALLLLTIWQGHRSTRSEQQRFAKIHLLVVVAVILITGGTYATLRANSQAREVLLHSSSPQYILPARDGQPSAHTCQTVTITGSNSFSAASQSCAQPPATPSRRLGYGIQPDYVVLAAALYLVAPLLNLYRFNLSPRHVAGQKKGKLFQ